jgi:ABC-type transporter Mla subunit MlaD
LWYNDTTQTVISGTPPANSLAPASTDALTNAQLRATPVPMVDQSAIDKAEQIRLLVVALSTYVDNIESLIGASNTLLTAGNANTDQIEIFLTTLNGLTTDVKTQVTAINTNTDQLEGLLTSLNTKLPTDLSGGRLKVEAFDKDEAFTVRGVTRDPTKDVIYDNSDGTSKRIYYAADGLTFAGVGPRG